MEIAMTNRQQEVEEKRLEVLEEILDWIQYAKDCIDREENNVIMFYSIPSLHKRSTHRIEILKAAINRLNNRYWKVLNK